MRWQKAAVLGGLLTVLALLALSVARDKPPWTTPLVGQTAPDFALELFDGGTLRLSDLRGKVVLVNFWASWCTACRVESPVLQWTWETYRSRGVVMIGVDIWDRREDALAMMREFGKTYPNGPDPRGKILQEYGVTGVPETFFIDRSGRIAYKHLGPVTRILIEDKVGELLSAAASP